MKKRMIIPMALAATMLFGCASSNESMNNDATAMDSDMSMSETQTMAGTTSDMEATDDRSSNSSMNTDNTADMNTAGNMGAASATAVANLTLENTGTVEDMFENIGNTEQYDVLSLAKQEPNLSTFVQLVEQAGLTSDIQRLDNVTIFAPTNEAFASIPQDKLESLLQPENKAQLMQVLQMHVLPQDVASAQLQNNTRIELTENSYIPVSVGMNNTMVTVGGAEIVRSDIEASNGRIHVIDGLIMPSDTRDDEAIGQ
ncbi:fasciclin domain-containing protein [Pontibacter mangrovi]|uniref:FAS1 domain-containing protein n=1 Tax=Pontibacter mangrovi TaxID=2589816 RepID=A0A501W1Z3_9BACT|nr:fasciclin domain-containing protein [Pontibacter mangrovi]TPE43639.1 hypothetical protein FJM65_12870 [Pontibacter mangrovi]